MTPAHTEAPDTDSTRARTYIAVLVVEVIVLLALWSFSRIFG